MLRKIRRRVATLIALAIPLPILAQVPGKSSPAGSDDMIPRELVLALLNIGQGVGGNTDIRVGKAPDNVPPELVPPGADLLGSMTNFDNAVVVVAMTVPPDSAISLLEARLLGTGWTRPPAPARMQRGGFVSADNVGYERPDVLCHGDEFIAFSGSYRNMGGSVIKLNYNRGGRFSACRNQTEVYRSPYEDAPIPTLRAPEGSMTTGGSGMSSSGANQVSLSTQLSTRLKPGDVIAHYDKQMRAAGWESVSLGNGDVVAAHTYRRRDDKGRTWTGTLVAVATPDGLEQDVMLRLSRR